jgi:hypothetical protein
VDGVGASVGRGELKQKISLQVPSLDIFEVVFSPAYSLFEISILNFDLLKELGTLHLRYS